MLSGVEPRELLKALTVTAQPGLLYRGGMRLWRCCD